MVWTQIGKVGPYDTKAEADAKILVETNRAAAAEASIQSGLDAHKSDTDNPHSVSKSQVGLGNVDNTSDADKPISTATQTALDNKADKTTTYTKTETDTALSAKADVSALTAETTRATNAESELSGRITTNADAITQLESEIAGKASATEVNTIKTDLGDLGDQVHGIEEKIPEKASTTNQLATMNDIQQAGGLSEVSHDNTMTGTGTADSPLSVKTDDFVKKSATEMQTISSPMTIKEEICLTDPDDNVAKHSLSIVAGVPTETATDMDIIGNRKYDTLPTTDDTTSYANLNPKSMITKGQVASAISTKANTSTVTALSTTVSNLSTTVAGKADTTTVNSELATKATKSTDFMTAITSTNKGATKNEIDALDDKIDIAGTSGKIIGSYWFGKTKTSTVVPAPTLVGQNYYDFTTGQVYKSTDGTTWTLDGTNTPPTDIDAQIIISSKFWDIPEQDNQHGGKAWWSHTNSEWSYSPTIYEDKPAGGASLPLLTPIWSDHKLNDVSYLNADTFSWQSGAVYEAAYQHLVDDIDGKSLTSETISGTTIQFYLSDDGHKICPASEESNVASIYSATGVAWYYIIDTVNQRFKLPRTKFGFTGIRSGVGNYVEAGLPNITGGFGSSVYCTAYNTSNPSMFGNGAFTTQDRGSAYNEYGHLTASKGENKPAYGYTFNASRSSSVYGNSDTVQPKATQMYLYFYVGNFTQTAVENTAGLNAELFNNKVDLVAGVPQDAVDYVIETQEPTAENGYTWYRKYKSGWVEQGCLACFLPVQDANTGAFAQFTFPIAMLSSAYDVNWARIVDGGSTYELTQTTVLSTTSNCYVGFFSTVKTSGQSQVAISIRGMAAN